MIWEYQPHFLASLQGAAEQVFDELAPALSPRIGLIGFSCVSEGGIVLDSDEGLTRGAADEAFRSVEKLAVQAAGLRESPEEVHRRINDHARQKGALALRRLRELVEGKLERRGGEQGVIVFVAAPVRVADHWVFVVLRLDREIYEVHAHLRGEVFSIASSLVDASIAEFLSASARALLEKAPGSTTLILGREPYELVRSAGSAMLARRTYELHGWGYPVDLFNACDAVSSMKYEGHEGRGAMIVSGINDPSVEVIVELRRRTPLGDYRSVRKLLEMATGQLALLSDAGYVYGLGRARGAALGPEASFRIEFADHFVWDVVAPDRTLMRVIHGRPTLAGQPISESQFRACVARLFGERDGVDADLLWSIALAATRQTHGTMILISDGAEAETKRLRNQCIPVRPRPMTPRIIETVTAIDGAVLIDPAGVGHAIGAILDGLARDEETSSRGARYNSAVRYTHTARSQFGHAAVAIVVSSDGMVDLIAPRAALYEDHRARNTLEMAAQARTRRPTPSAPLDPSSETL